MKKLIFCLFLMFSVCGTAFGKGYVKPRFPKKKPVVRYVKRNIRPKRTVRQTARTTIKTPTPRLRTIKYETIDLSHKTDFHSLRPKGKREQFPVVEQTSKVELANHNSDLLKEWQKDFRTQLNQIPSINISLPPKAQSLPLSTQTVENTGNVKAVSLHQNKGFVFDIRFIDIWRQANHIISHRESATQSVKIQRDAIEELGGEFSGWKERMKAKVMKNQINPSDIEEINIFGHIIIIQANYEPYYKCDAA